MAALNLIGNHLKSDDIRKGSGAAGNSKQRELERKFDEHKEL